MRTYGQSKRVLRAVLLVMVVVLAGGVLPAAPVYAAGGTVVAWGFNESGQTTVPPTAQFGVIDISAGGHHTLALKADGSLVAWGEPYGGLLDIPAEATNIVAIDSGEWHAVALRGDGTVIAWGSNNFGQCDVPSDLGSDVIAVAAGGTHTLALKSDGTVRAWGANDPDFDKGQTDVPVDLGDVIALAAGQFHSVALKADGTVVAWGLNASGQIDVPSGLTDVVAIAAGGFHTMAIRSDGRIVSWGYLGGPPGDYTSVVDADGGFHFAMLLLADGTVVAWGDNWAGQTNVPLDLTDAMAIAAGGYHAAALVPAVTPPDATKPVITATLSPNVNADGWHNSDVTVAFVCADEEGGSGIAEDTLVDVILTDEGLEQSVASEGVCIDQAGNQADMVTVDDINIDKTPPVVTVTGVANGAVYTVGSVPAAGCDTQDALSGVQTAATLSMSGSSEVGTVTATCAGALDYAGNAGMATATYQVHYPFNGFFPPVDNVPAVNLVNAGQAIAIKFSLDGDRGLDLFLEGYPASQSHVCGGSEALGPVEPAATPGKSSLTYDAVSDQYIFVWKTEKSWSGTCRQFLLGLKDGAAHTAEFQFQFKGKGVHGAAVDDVSGTQNEHVFLPLITR